MVEIRNITIIPSKRANCLNISLSMLAFSEGDVTVVLCVGGLKMEGREHIRNMSA